MVELRTLYHCNFFPTKSLRHKYDPTSSIRHLSYFPDTITIYGFIGKMCLQSSEKWVLFNYPADTWGLVRVLFGSLRRILLFMHPIKLQIESDRRTQYGPELIKREMLLGTLGWKQYAAFLEYRTVLVLVVVREMKVAQRN